MHVEWVDDEAVVLEQETGRVHYLNPPAALVYALVIEHGFDAAITKLKEGENGARGDEVDALLDEMVARGLLTDG